MKELFKNYDVKPLIKRILFKDYVHVESAVYSNHDDVFIWFDVTWHTEQEQFCETFPIPIAEMFIDPLFVKTLKISFEDYIYDLIYVTNRDAFVLNLLRRTQNK